MFPALQEAVDNGPARHAARRDALGTDASLTPNRKKTVEETIGHDIPGFPTAFRFIFRFLWYSWASPHVILNQLLRGRTADGSQESLGTRSVEDRSEWRRLHMTLK